MALFFGVSDAFWCRRSNGAAAAGATMAQSTTVGRDVHPQLGCQQHRLSGRPKSGKPARRQVWIRDGADAAQGEARPRYEWITSCRSNMPTNCSIFFARVSALFTVWIRNRMAYRFALFKVAKNAFALGCASSAR